MNIQINYGTGVATLPTAALGSLDRATKADIKLLLILCAEPRYLAAEERETCIGRLAERMGCSAAQVEASLAFWRGVGILNEDEDAEVGGEAPAPSVAAPARTDEAPAADTPAAASAVPPTVTVTRAPTRMLDEIPNYSPEDMENFFAKRGEAETYMIECQEIWGTVFTAHDTRTIIALVEQWGFSWEYVVTLIAAAEKHFRERENQGKSLNYVYRTAVGYHKEGITTVEALQQKFVEQEKMAEFEKRIRAMFGLGIRNLTPKEKKYFSTWLYEYRYGIDVVELAYNVTVDAKGSPNPGYTNGVLKHWYEDGLRTAEEISAKLENDAVTVKAVKEGKLTPDNAKETLEAVLQASAAENNAPPSFSRDAGILRRLMNLGNRLLTEGETSAMIRWRQEYGFSYEIIYRAYQITLENRREYNLPYMDAVLKNWHEAGLTTLEAIAAYDKGFREDKLRTGKKTPAAQPLGNSSFETDDFFMAAVKRSFGEDFDPDILKQ